MNFSKFAQESSSTNMNRKEEDENYMRRCIQLAHNGAAGAPPNPMVGAVIVCDGRIIGEGYHRRCGQAHAEVNAIRSVRESELLKRSTIYVSLEPCSHYGKTPPCADLIIEKQIPRVVVGCIDPFARVSGQGIRKLRDAGIEVTVGVLENECRNLNRRFITFHSERRPYVVLKWAQSADGFIDKVREGGHPVMLSSPETQMLAHKHRAECKAILVGRRTALLDNPSLTARSWCGDNPLRLVIDRSLTLPFGLHLFDGSTSTIVFTEKNLTSQHSGVDHVRLDFSQDLLPQIMTCLHERNIQSLLVEGGSHLLQSFIDARLWDEVFVERVPLRLEDGVPAPTMPSNACFQTENRFGSDYLHFYRLACWQTAKDSGFHAN